MVKSGINRDFCTVPKKLDKKSTIKSVEQARGLCFRGSFQHSIDEKGRVSFPAVFRQALSELNISSLVITNFITDGARCLEGYPKDSWIEFEKKLAKRSRFDPKIRKLENFYLARAVECGIDSSGRINIPNNLIQYAGFEKEVVFTASLHGFRIWDLRVWELIFQEAESALFENPALFMDVDL